MRLSGLNCSSDLSRSSASALALGNTADSALWRKEVRLGIEQADGELLLRFDVELFEHLRGVLAANRAHVVFAARIRVPELE